MSPAERGFATAAPGGFAPLPGTVKVELPPTEGREADAPCRAAKEGAAPDVAREGNSGGYNGGILHGSPVDKPAAGARESAEREAQSAARNQRIAAAHMRFLAKLLARPKSVLDSCGVAATKDL